MDAIAVYEARVNADKTLTVNMTSEYAAGSILQHLGYVISGTTRDGAYLEVRDQPSSSDPTDVAFFLDTPPDLLPGACDTPLPPAACTAGLPLTATRTFLPGTGSGATLLNSPLWYAAKYGNKTSGRLREGEASGNYFLVTNAANLSKQLETAFFEILGLVSSSSAAATNSTSLRDDTVLYQARFDSGDWTGEVRAVAVEADGSLGATRWTTNTAALIPPAAQRNVITFNGRSGLEFLRAELPNLSLAQCAGLLDTDTATLSTHLTENACNPGAGPTARTWCQCSDLDPALDLTAARERLDWLRGDQSLEVPKGPYRVRRLRLGDIINSNPFLANNRDYDLQVLADLHDETSYEEFLDQVREDGRPQVLYVGANDGMLHAFHAETGQELFAYLPAEVYSHIADLTDPEYPDQHRYFLDGSPWVMDAWLEVEPRQYAWRTVLVGSTGAGGRAVFALDVTDPEHFGGDDVLWEFSDPELGVTLGRPTIARLPYGWVALFGNGYNSQSAHARLFVVDLSSGRLLRSLDTGAGSGNALNGLATPIPVDMDDDRITERAYAGDLLGNLWRFDLGDVNPANWSVAFNGQPLFRATAPDLAGQPKAQPITSRPAVAQHPFGGVMVLFGTGKFFSEGDEVVRTTNPPQSLYGVRDMDAPITDGRDALQDQHIIYEGLSTDRTIRGEMRVVSNTEVDYAHYSGWYLDLQYQSNREGERIIEGPTLRGDRIVFITLIPSEDACSAGGGSWLMELDYLHGARLPYSVFDLNDDDGFTVADFIAVEQPRADEPNRTATVMLPASALLIPAIAKTPVFISVPGNNAGATAKDVKFLSISANGALLGVDNLGNTGSGRQSWRQLR